MDNSPKLTALKPDMVVTILKQAGSRLVTPELVTEDLTAGAPVNPDGTINFIEFMAWLAREGNNDSSNQSE